MTWYPGQLCQSLRISSKNLLKNNLKPLSWSAIILIIELMRFASCQKLPMMVVLKWLELLSGKNWPKSPPAELTSMKALSDLHQKYPSLKTGSDRAL